MAHHLLETILRHHGAQAMTRHVLLRRRLQLSGRLLEHLLVLFDHLVGWLAPQLVLAHVVLLPHLITEVL